MTSFDQWIDDMTTLVTYEQIAFRRKLFMDKFNDIWKVFIKTIVTHEVRDIISLIYLHTDYIVLQP